MSLFTRKEPRLRFEFLQTETDVADALAAFWGDLQRLGDETFKGPLYEPINLPKKGRHHHGEERTVYNVARELRRLHTEILESLRTQVPVSELVFGFVRGRSTLGNAREHYGAKILLNLDIKDFFDSIREAQIIKSFRSLGTGDEAARLLASICCLRGSLPQGAATSPILSNLVCAEMDPKLAALAERQRAKYTRYADDISFSGDTVPDVEQVENVLAAYGFALNPEKTRKRRCGEAQYVTGLTLGSARGVRLPTRFRRYLRMQLYNADRRVSDSEDGQRASDVQLSGRLAYAYSVEPEWTVLQMKKFPLGVPDDWKARTPPAREPKP